MYTLLLFYVEIAIGKGKVEKKKKTFYVKKL